MNILHVLSQTEVTGAEVYAVTLAERQLMHGHNVLLVSDTLTVCTKADYIALPISKRSYANRLRNIGSLSSIIGKRGIDVIHAHSRAASWVSFFARRASDAVLVSTVHGRQHMHPSVKLLNIYGDHVIAISESIRKQLVDEIGMRADRVCVVPNGLCSSVWHDVERCGSKTELFGISNDTKLIVFAGRLTGPKGDVVRKFLNVALPEIMKTHRCVFCIIGGTIIPEEFGALIGSAKDRMGTESIQLKEFQHNVLPYLRAADLVIGSGRVAIEALALGKPLLAFGESNFVGGIRECNIERALESNFGDTGIFLPSDCKEVVTQSIAMLEQPPGECELRSLQRLIKEKCDIVKVESAIQAIYEQAIREKSPNKIVFR